MNSFLELVTVIKMNFFLVILQGFSLKVLEDFFHHGTSMLLQNTSFYIGSDSKYIVHSLFKIIQNYVNNKINN